MNITPSKCQLVESTKIPDSFDFTKTLKEFNITFVDYESDTESFDNDVDTAVVLCKNDIDPWELFKAVYSLKPDEFLFERVKDGIVICMMWDDEEQEI